jgi:hypothetical protein
MQAASFIRSERLERKLTISRCLDASFQNRGARRMLVGDTAH